MGDTKPPRPGTWESLKAVSKSWRLASVVLLMFSSSLPLALVWITIPTWIACVGADIRTVGLFTLAQAPWSFKFLWSPFLDRFSMPFLGRKRGWIVVMQALMVVCGLALARAAEHPENLWPIAVWSLAMAFASATYDIAYDAYAVEALRPEEQGVASAARVAIGRVAMLVSGGAAITLAVDALSWSSVFLILALCHIPMMVVAIKAPEPEAPPAPPRSLKEAVWSPFVGFLAQHRAVEILAFVVLFKLSDNLTQALLRPFFVQMGFGAFDVGVGSMLAGTVALALGAAIAGVLIQPLGLGRALWIFGFLQIFSNLGYAVVAVLGPSRPALYAAQVVEMGTSGLGTGAFMVLLLRLTQKRFSATQYALLSSLMAITRVLTGPPAGFLVDAMGWRDFFVLTLLAGVPGMWMLARFVPWSLRDPVFHVADPARARPLTRWGLVVRSAAIGLASLAVAVLVQGCLNAARAYTTGKVKAVVGSVDAAGVGMTLRMSEGARCSGELTIREVKGTVPAVEFEGEAPAVGGRVTVVQEKGADGAVRFSRRKARERRFELGPQVIALLHPASSDGWLTFAGLVLLGVLAGLAAAATLAARRGLAGGGSRGVNWMAGGTAGR